MRCVLVGLLVCLVIPGCDSSSGNGDGGKKEYEDICDPELDEKCGLECISSVDCGPNTYCGEDGTCRADCSPGGGECGEGWVCIGNGHCAEECASVTVNLEIINPTVVLLIDQSGSMDDPFSGQPRWDAVKEALNDAPNAVVPALQGEILFGASLYTSHGGNGGGACPILQTVNPKLDNAGPIKSLLDDNEPDGDTPTGESIVAVVDHLDSLPSDSITPLRLIVCATDGEPDTCEEPNPQNGQEESIQGAQAAWARGVKTVMLSVGSDVSAGHMQDMANAGSGLPVGGGQDAPYYVANNPDELVAAFEDITQSARSCAFALDGEIQPPEYAAYGEVRLNGEALPYDDPDGWRMINASTMELVGEACQTYLNDDNAELSASFPCGTVWVP